MLSHTEPMHAAHTIDITARQLQPG